MITQKTVIDYNLLLLTITPCLTTSNT